ncbi:MAG: C-terminal target protein [Fluviicola sp.]|jgi:hypothetical protein|uniref:T9SS type A sorting domain-containing protein n=1 Tax=Fluviicola sp. TaxID=1917219 RepID=UPI002616E642|nr:T9SS type A sorting domain-containing protein [Fluviicola sp.]MDF3029016.1 C-terminal target protein [Fluviicola sp.]
MKLVLSILLIAYTFAARAQFGTGINITPPSEINNAWAVAVADLDDDGDKDVLSASETEGHIACYENMGNFTFGPRQVISDSASVAHKVHGSDLDGDGDLDVLSASMDKIAWYENTGNFTFGVQQIITQAVESAQDVTTADLDNDADPDVLVASFGDDRITWYENLGNGTFGPQQVFDFSMFYEPTAVFVTDLDADGKDDVLGAFRDGIAWCKGHGNGTFDYRSEIIAEWAENNDVFACDLDGDGLSDVISAGRMSEKISWHKNLGSGVFGPQQTIIQYGNPKAVYAADFDNDGDNDLLSTYYSLGERVQWHENQGDGNFEAPVQISGPISMLSGRDVIAADMNNDGYTDVLSAAKASDEELACYPNLFAFAGLAESNSINSSIYPNPANDLLHIDWNTSAENAVNITIYAITGEKVRELNDLISNTYTLNISTLEKGAYLVTLIGRETDFPSVHSFMKN